MKTMEHCQQCKTPDICQSYTGCQNSPEKEKADDRLPLMTCSASLIWHAGPAQGGGGTAQSESPNGHTSWWWDGDLLLVVVETNGGPFVRLVKVNADGDLLSFDDPDTGDDNFGYTDMDISWWAKIEESLPQNDTTEARES